MQAGHKAEWQIPEPEVSPLGKKSFMSASATLKSSSAKSTGLVSNQAILLPYLVGVGAQIPMLLLYFRNLWAKPHYQFFPIALIALGVFAFMRWPRTEGALRQSWSSVGMLLLGLVCGIGAWLYMEPWFAMACLFALSASLLSMVIDRETDKSLVSISLLALICLTPPFGLDSRLITWLQQVSARVTTSQLDLVGYPHYMPGTVILAPGTSGFGIEEACSGVQSFFTLLFVAAFFIVFFRRPWFRSLLLLASVIFWAIFMNSLRIFAIPIAQYLFKWDLAHGLPHALLGYATLGLGILMVYSTDQFLLFLFGPTERFDGDESNSTGAISRFWNYVISGDAESQRKRRASSSPTQTNIMVMWGIVGVLGLAGLMTVVDVFRSLTQPELKVRLFETDVEVPLAKDDLPESVMGDWQLVEYKYEERTRGSDLGRLSNTWTFLSPEPTAAERAAAPGEQLSRFVATFSFDQTFPGWHELTTCYKNQGWKINVRLRNTGKGEEGEKNWPFVTAQMSNSVGQYGFVVFSLFDSFGEAVDAPGDWNVVQWIIRGSTNRMRNRIRGSLFRAEAYQSQMFVTQYRPISPAMEEVIIEKYLEAREQARQQFLVRRKQEDGGATPAPSSTETAMRVD